jgi:hypothetical protein
VSGDQPAPSNVSHWDATHCPAPWCGVRLVTQGRVTTCPRSLSHYTRVLAVTEDAEQLPAEQLPKLPGRA